MKHILVVDDNITNLKFVEQTLKPYFKVTLLTSAVQTMKFLLKYIPDLILLDINMPGIDGFQTLSTIKSIDKLKNVPIIFLTIQNDIESELKALKLGAMDFISKPFIPEIIISRINTQLELASYRTELEGLVAEKTATIENLQDTMVMGLAELVECRDGETGGHIKRTAKYVEILAEAICINNLYFDTLNCEYVNNMIRSAPLHDIGKIGISDSILLKNGSFDEDEREYMKQHTILGGKALQNLIDATDGESFLYIAKDMALSHHEKWDGTGYPYGLSTTDIPLCARVMALSDVYDALTSKRPYKEPFSHSEAFDIIVESSGTHFDPELVKVFKTVHKKFEKVSKLYLQEMEVKCNE